MMNEKKNKMERIINNPDKREMVMNRNRTHDSSPDAFGVFPLSIHREGELRAMRGVG